MDGNGTIKSSLDVQPSDDEFQGQDVLLTVYHKIHKWYCIYIYLYISIHNIQNHSESCNLSQGHIMLCSISPSPGNKLDGPTALNLVAALCDNRIDLDILRCCASWMGNDLRESQKNHRTHVDFQTFESQVG